MPPPRKILKTLRTGNFSTVTPSKFSIKFFLFLIFLWSFSVLSNTEQEFLISWVKTKKTRSSNKEKRNDFFVTPPYMMTKVRKKYNFVILSGIHFPWYPHFGFGWICTFSILPWCTFSWWKWHRKMIIVHLFGPAPKKHFTDGWVYFFFEWGHLVDKYGNVFLIPQSFRNNLQLKSIFFYLVLEKKKKMPKTDNKMSVTTINGIFGGSFSVFSLPNFPFCLLFLQKQKQI